MGGKNNWLVNHIADPYVRLSRQQNYRSRAAYKLLQLHMRDRLFKKNSVIVDLGSAPGGWSQVLSDLVGKTGKVISFDMLSMKAISGVKFIQGDFLNPLGVTLLQEALQGKVVDWVVSDMAPAFSGVAAVDQVRSFELARSVVNFVFNILCAKQIFHKKGSVLIKVFQGDGFDAFLSEMKKKFTRVLIRKPDASRSSSSEVYLLGFMQ